MEFCRFGELGKLNRRVMVEVEIRVIFLMCVKCEEEVFVRFYFGKKVFL